MHTAFKRLGQDLSKDALATLFSKVTGLDELGPFGGLAEKTPLLLLRSIVVLFSQLSAYSLGRLLRLPKKEVDQTLEGLHDILDIPEDSVCPLRLRNPSFRDFLLDEKQAYQTLAASCIQLMSTSLKEDVYNVGLPDTLVADIESSQIQRCLPLKIQYACLYWI